MKFLCVFVSLLILAQEIKTGFVGDLADLGRDVAKKAHDDLHRLFHREDKRKDQVVFETKPDDEKPFVFASATSTTTQTSVKEVPNVKPERDNTQANNDNSKTTHENDKVDPPKPENATNEKEGIGSGNGKENFAGACSTGFKKTTDGRCMPTFG